MTRPLIGLTTYGRNEKNQYQLLADYSWSIFRAGGAPILLPPVGDGSLAKTWLARMDALVLTGGGDMDPRLYGEERHPTMYTLDQERDTSEMVLAREALESDLPILAICRGLQVFNVALGGTLYPHLPDSFGEKVAHRLPPREPALHKVTLAPDCRLAALLGTDEVNGVSWHHQAIHQLGSGMVATGHAPDGVIEAAEIPACRWFIGVQWHPEMSSDHDPLQQRIFDGVVAAAASALS